ncbi:SDR family NAD(P)-dependent oxidoreductase [Flavobacteriaceae bacterium R33]|uniref:SDR family NAD(P)-dependent oxidoreductase n=1 Tax=Poritiphilus flavus TaxID=2697053 RepID=A0A6L9EG85_9FLAO|nr:SDR family NAD(P)-dependent oxidoreductase [Poritiphilus flavus]
MQTRIALVTGANRGIGHAVAKGLLQKGIKVIATSRKESDGQGTVERLSAFGDVIYQQLDVTDISSVENAFDFVRTEFGKLDILVNNAGINYDSWHNVQNADLDEVRVTLETNTLGPWQTIQTFLPLLRKSESARIVNVSSGAGSLSSQTGGTPAYSLSKLALNGLTLQFAGALKKDRILVNAVCPGWVRTDMGGSGATRSVEEGADTIIWAALLENENLTGKFFRDRREIAW